MSPGQGNEVRSILYDGLLLALHPSETPLLFRAVLSLNFFAVNEDPFYGGKPWRRLCNRITRIQMVYLDAGAITSLSKWFMNPLLEAEA